MRKPSAALLGIIMAVALIGVPTGSIAETADPVPNSDVPTTTPAGSEACLVATDDYTLLTDTLAGLIDENGEALQVAALDEESEGIIANLQQAAARNGDAVEAVIADDSSAPTETAEAADAASATARTIQVQGQVIPYTDAHLWSTAPEEGAGLWSGSDSTDDGRWGYFIGHNPGAFSCLLGLTANSPVTITDSAGHARTYHVVKSFDVPNTTTWKQIAGDVTGYGESIILQTCIDGGANYRIFVAA